MMVLGLDGWIETEPIAAAGCCALEPDLDRCTFMERMVDLLPSGPLWDRAKAEAMDTIRKRAVIETDCDDLECVECAATECGSLAGFAIFLGEMLFDSVMDFLLPSIRESRAVTAIGSVDRWLGLFEWQSCFEAGCLDPRLGISSPILAARDECTKAVCAPACESRLPADLDEATRQAVLEAMRRMKLRPRGNLAGINFVIAPLGAVLSVDEETVRTYQKTHATSESCCSRGFFCLSPTSDVLPLRYLDAGRPASRDVQSWYLADCNIGPKVRPGLLAAHCIALAMLPPDACDTTAPIRWCNCEV